MDYNELSILKHLLSIFKTQTCKGYAYCEDCPCSVIYEGENEYGDEDLWHLCPFPSMEDSIEKEIKAHESTWQL